MGVNVADMEWSLHGEGSTHHPIAVRLHYGIKGIDETHTMSDAAMSAMLAEVVAGDGPAFRALAEAWVLAHGSTAAQAYASDFAAAGWAAWP